MNQNKKRFTHFFASNSGAINGMIHENLSQLQPSELNISLNFVELFKMNKLIDNFKKKCPKQNFLNDFLKFKQEQQTLFTSYPIIEHMQKGEHGNYKNQIWIEDNKKEDIYFRIADSKDKITIEQYMQFAIEKIQPTYIVSPVENNLEQTGCKKRAKSCLQSISNFIDATNLAINSKHQCRILMPIWIDMLNNDNDYQRNNYTEQILKAFGLFFHDKEEQNQSLISGIMIYGLQNQKLTLTQKYDYFQSFINLITKLCSIEQCSKQLANKIKEREFEIFCQCSGHPLEVIMLSLSKNLKGVIHGIEHDYPLILAQSGKCLNLYNYQHSSEIRSIINDDLDVQQINNLLSELENKYKVQSEEKSSAYLNEFEILREEYKESSEPLCDNCKCYTCINYNRAYLYHLADMKEINYQILLSIHNLQQYNQLFNLVNSL